MTTHIVIPDTQVAPGLPIDHLGWIGAYLVDEFAHKSGRLEIIHLGDHWTMQSLSSYDKGMRRAEGSRYEDDVESGNAGMRLLTGPIHAEQKLRRRAHRPWDVGLHLLRGNHEERIERATQASPELFKKLDYKDLESPGWETHGFLEPVLLDGILYSHYFINPANGRPQAGMIETRIKSLGSSFTQGHQQGLKVGMVETVAGRRRGIVAGSCYLHNEEYRGPQGQTEWRGILVCWEVVEGDYDLMEVSLGYLCRRYEGVSLAEFLS